jgi:hypothetical protein
MSTLKAKKEIKEHLSIYVSGVYIDLIVHIKSMPKWNILLAIP